MTGTLLGLFLGAGWQRYSVSSLVKGGRQMQSLELQAVSWVCTSVKLLRSTENCVIVVLANVKTGQEIRDVVILWSVRWPRYSGA